MCLPRRPGTGPLTEEPRSVSAAWLALGARVGRPSMSCCLHPPPCPWGLWTSSWAAQLPPCSQPARSPACALTTCGLSTHLSVGIQSAPPVWQSRMVPGARGCTRVCWGVRLQVYPRSALAGSHGHSRQDFPGNPSRLPPRVLPSLRDAGAPLLRQQPRGRVTASPAGASVPRKACQRGAAPAGRLVLHAARPR